MGLQLQMLGTGSAFAKNYYNNNALLYDGTFTLLIDCGVTAPLALYRLGMSFNDIDAVLITHIHADHVGGLEELAFKTKFTFKRKMILYITEELAHSLWEHTLKGGLYQEGEISSLEDIFEVRLLHPLKPQYISELITVELFPTKHIPGKASYSLYINENIFYSSDMTFEPSLLLHLVQERGCRTIFHECQLSGPGEVHTTLQELLTLPTEIQKNTYLMHYADDRDDYLNQTGEMTFLEQNLIYEL
ncbi:MBL fold metallo-hydrolase [Paenibacillus glacialis]|uniref:MBL fold metallo-hydrolase n=1 Tax=Paenibacillus glacialis TaxID=494026 RepID=A0A168D435_9BACL|nr:MBL fold metallo-hydrolase [Paenibacillus glacialis]OAB33851.1 MBL fold metallo-hydrolase [Paenibacillus glacialis]